MPGEDTPLKHKSSESVTDADVQRLLNIALRRRCRRRPDPQKYAELSMVSPYIFILLAKLGLSIVSGFRLKAEGATSLSRKKWKNGLTQDRPEEQVPNIAHCLVRDGTTAVNLPAEKEGDIKQMRVYKILNLIKKSQGPDSNRNGIALQAIA
jgi:hypothetical protein